MLNLAEFWLVSMIMIGSYILFFIARFLCQKIKKINWEKHYAEKLAQYKYNVVIRLFLEFYIELALFSMVNIIQVISGSSTFYVSSFSISVIIFLICIYLPVFIHRVFKEEQQALLRK